MSICITFVRLFNNYVFERQRRTDKESVWARKQTNKNISHLLVHQYLEMSTRAKSQIQELNLGLPHRWQEPNHLNHHYIPGVNTGRSLPIFLEQRALGRLKLDEKNSAQVSNMGSRNPGI